VSPVNALQLLRWQHTRARRLLGQARGGDLQARTEIVALLREHATAEEEHVLAKLEGDDAIATALEDAYREHEILGDVLLELDRTPSDARELAALLEELEELLETHIQIGEGSLFPYIERAWPSSMLDEVGKTMALSLQTRRAR
jgi:hemerythrin-like domain-containing protein